MKRKNKILLFIILAILSLLIFYISFLLLKSKQPALVPVQNVTPNPTGKIYLSLAPKFSSNSDNVTAINPTTGIYAFDLNSHKIEKVFTDTKDENNYTLRFSADRTKAAFVSDRLDTEKGYGNIFVMDSDQKNLKNLTDSDISDKQLPTWSPDGSLIAYTQLNDSINPEASAVRILDMQGKDKFLTWGAYPLFSPDGKQVLVLKKYGLFLVNVSDGKSEGPLLETMCVESGCNINVKVNLSKDKKLIAFTDSFQKKIGIYKIESWAPLKVSLVKEIDSVVAFWPVFSPNGKYLAFQQIIMNGNEISKVKLVAYNLNTFQTQDLIDLSQYQTGHIWLTDWQK